MGRPQRGHALNEVTTYQSAQDHAGVRQYPHQAEMLFQDLCAMNMMARIALHHGSLDVRSAQSRGRESPENCAAWSAPSRSISASTGADVDLVINIGAPKGGVAADQRIGRANHRIDEASRAVLVPANRSRCWIAVAIDAIAESAPGHTALTHPAPSVAGAATSSAAPGCTVLPTPLMRGADRPRLTRA